MKPVSQPVVLILLAVFFILGAFAGKDAASKMEPTNDQNNDGVVNLTDFSIALARANSIADQMRNEKQPANVIEDVYPPVPLPYEPQLKTE